MKDIDVYGPIGDDWDEDAVSASEFVRQLRDAGGEDVTVHINSSGGSVFDANAMSEAVRSYRGRITASIEGLAASAASYFALAADEVVVNPAALVMIHNPWDIEVGDSSAMRRKADMLDKARSTISGQYARKTGREVSEIEGLMDAETWFTASEAVEFGLADRVTDEEPVAACLKPEDMKRFRNAPKGLFTSDERKPADETRNDAGDPRDSFADADDSDAEAGAAETVAGAATRTVCVNGQFLYE
jgi:ATP-dependent Clp protease, protease subunit